MVTVAGEKFPDDLACIICSHVLDGSPVWIAARDADGDWQFFCDRTHEAADARVISLAEALELDGRLARLPVLARGQRMIIRK